MVWIQDPSQLLNGPRRQPQRWGMAQRKTLTQRQVDVLRWIGDGCPDGVMVEAGRPERITAGALRNRGLVTTTGRGPTWWGFITEAGVEYLTRVDGPNPPIPREPGRGGTQNLIDEVVAAGGTLSVPARRWGAPPGTPDYERRVANAERRGVLPAGKRLVVTRSPGELHIQLRDAAAGTPTAASPVPVAERVGRYHQVVMEFRGQEESHHISRAEFSRACRIAHALVVEAERRGYGVGVSTGSGTIHRRRSRSGESGGDLVITIGGVAVTLRISEKGVAVPSSRPTNDRWDLPGYAPARRSFANEEGATGLLLIAILAPSTRSNRQASWGDGKKQRLEDCLPAVLMEAETRSADERERIRLAQEEAERARQAWEEAMERARALHAESHRAVVLVEQVEGWQQATAIRAYCDAIQQAHPGPGPAAEWIAWARLHADRIDPLDPAPTLPGLPAQVTAEDLRPFLGGWSPYGPDRS